jgi:hypothetical protein
MRRNSPRAFQTAASDGNDMMICSTNCVLGRIVPIFTARIAM